jgi:DNA adenine methylase
MSYGDVLAEYETHPEPKSAAADGTPCSRTTRGLLQRRPVRATSIVYIGKESNRLEEVEEGLIHSPDEVQEVYRDPRQDPWLTHVVPVLKMIPRRDLARAGLSESQIKRLRNGHCMPSAKTRLLLTRAAGDYARSQLGPGAPADDLAACAALMRSSDGPGPYQQSSVTAEGGKMKIAVEKSSITDDAASVGMDTLGPPLKWAGGKRWQVPYFRKLWRAHAGRRLVEPFCGGLAITLGLRPERALLNDILSHLMNFYRRLRQGLVSTIPMTNDALQFYAYREQFNRLIIEGNSTSQEAAELFYYLNRTGFNGLCRFNQSCLFNVPFGRYKNISYTHDFSAYRNAFRNWDFVSTDFENLSLEHEDFIYADPPYDVEFTQYAQNGFSWADQVRVAAWLAAHSGPVVLTNQATERIMELYRSLGFQLAFLHAPRRISCTGDRSPVQEVIATKNL